MKLERFASVNGIIGIIATLFFARNIYFLWHQPTFWSLLSCIWVGVIAYVCLAPILGFRGFRLGRRGKKVMHPDKWGKYGSGFNKDLDIE